MANATETPLPFQLRKIGHVVLNVHDLEAALRFSIPTCWASRSATDIRQHVPGGMIFLRCNPDHHGVALVGGPRR